MLKLRGLLVLRIPVPPFRDEGSFKWVMDPIASERCLLDATWYADGSLTGGKSRDLRTTGFGLVVVAPSSELLGYGFGASPSRVDTAAAAEVWAIQTANMLSPTLPKIKTDCLSIITFAAAGTLAVTSHGKVLARI